MPQTRTSCPRCHQPVMAEINQLFDTGADPQAKQKILSGAFNMVSCPSCGYQGPLSVPMVYHDAEKELLLTYFPPELGMPVTEQEKMIGPMINQVVNRLPLEKRKAYLLRPETMLTLQTLVERVLAADGITKEMLDAQQKRLALLQQLLSVSPESREEILHQNEALVDENFFGILNRLAEVSVSSGDQQSARAIVDLQKMLMEKTEVGRAMQVEYNEAEAAVHSLKELSQNGLTREKLLDLMIEAPTETRLRTLVSLARNGMDYSFFQLLAERIESTGDQKLTDLREKLLAWTKEIDDEFQEHVQEMRKLLEQIIAAPDPKQATQQALEIIDQSFVDLLQTEIEAAQKGANLERGAKLGQIMNVLQEASAPPPEYKLIESLISVDDDASRRKLLEENADLVTDQLLQALNGLAAQMQSQNQPAEIVEKLQAAHRVALRFSMERNLQK